MNGCFNRPPLHNPAWPGRTPIPFRMEPECQYTKSNLGQADKGCTGYKHKKPIATDGATSIAINLVAPACVEWSAMSSCPQGKSVLLLGEGGLPTVGRYMRGSQDFWQGWAELPVKAAE